MSENKDWQQEFDRVKYVSQFVNQKIQRIKKYMTTLKERVIDIRKDFWDDVTVNLSELDDAIETQASLKQQAEFLSERERSHGQLGQQLSKLLDLKEKPYFGRIDFIEQGDRQTEEIYIGTASLMDEQEEEFLVYDWRAPISSMYYDYAPGPAAYEAVTEKVDGEITLKRQYVIKQGQLTGMFDTGLTIGDHLLQSVLGESSDTKMKSIVATIQREQNKIIRNEKSRILVVQGVAGSGKTSAALQRVAYLLYRYREELKADQMILFSPNPLFNSYVASVLPELGEENIKQMTFYHYVDQQLGNRFTVESPFEQLEATLKQREQHDQVRLQAMHYKSSEAYQHHVDAFLEQLKAQGLVFRNIRFRNQLLFNKDTLNHFFYQLPSNMSIQNRLVKMTEWLLTNLKEKERGFLKAEWLEDELELLDKADFQEAYYEMQSEQEEQFESYNDSEKEALYLKAKWLRKQLKPLRQKITQFKYVDTMKTYLQLFEQEGTAEMKDEEWQHIARFTKQHITQRYLTWEDATPFLYFERMLIGFDENRMIKHIILDEAQDYSTFQLKYLARIYPSCRMTLLGDVNQAIYYHALSEQNVLQHHHYDEQSFITLWRSYRSTKQIIEFSKAFMPNGSKIEAFNRSGSLPVVLEVENKTIAEHKLYEAIDGYTNKGFNNIAVITKTLKEAEELANLIKPTYPESHLVNIESHTFNPGVQIIPTYLAKGIEFDAVIVYNASATHYQDELERNLLYTGCTRAMHALTVIAIEEVSAYIKEVPTQFYHYYKVHQISGKQ
ncbi:DNA helicase-2 / ATP-dependent DNA helicase PcrA [Amphibacillus marinus]|uniref:DNA helicase-2 / ATP-dependent DNA helicase PcrA n=1 Tax=Amphibacillus marinus TaxID=872970 RepID=A0A1H8MJW7_9BACI|nr:RNA polymerase recycling motor HelD [Amphibacillus marinus]SEO17528.1 DNA helicase-2 / ATP-dependent DNA helicase PcrA [Amphibacillus marinus]